MGFSFISVAEIIFHCCMSFCKGRIPHKERQFSTTSAHSNASSVHMSSTNKESDDSDTPCCNFHERDYDRGEN